MILIDRDLIASRYAGRKRTDATDHQEYKRVLYKYCNSQILLLGKAHPLNPNMPSVNSVFCTHRGFSSLSQLPSVVLYSHFSHPHPPPYLSWFSLSSRVYCSSRLESYWRFRTWWIREGSFVPGGYSLL